ncbi:MAG: hypothetical protein WCI18_15235 [Pseudomonadota bacterium]
MHIKKTFVFICVLFGGVLAWLISGTVSKSLPSKSEVVAGEERADSDAEAGASKSESLQSNGTLQNQSLSAPLNFPPKSASMSIVQAKTDLNSFLLDFIFKAVSQNLSYLDAKKLITAAGVSLTEINSGNKDTGERVQLSFEEATSLGLSIFSLTYQKGDTEAFDRLLYGRSPEPSVWNEEFNRMKLELDEKFSPYSILKKESELFALWRLKDEKIVWINGDHQGYGQKMILVGYEYEIH